MQLYSGSENYRIGSQLGSCLRQEGQKQLELTKGPTHDNTYSHGPQKADVRLLGSNGRLWPFPAVQAMKSIRGRPTAACDPTRTFRRYWPPDGHHATGAIEDPPYRSFHSSCLSEAAGCRRGRRHLHRRSVEDKHASLNNARSSALSRQHGRRDERRHTRERA